MWIRDVDVPQGLIDAHREGRLVIFVGAGASRDAPSNLPDFRTLTEQIAADSGVVVTLDELSRPDQLLGVLKDTHSVDVHRRVADMIGDSSERNALHDAVVALAAAADPVRIVTTNYDQHLSTAAHERGLALTEYTAPAPSKRTVTVDQRRPRDSVAIPAPSQQNELEAEVRYEPVLSVCLQIQLMDRGDSGEALVEGGAMDEEACGCRLRVSCQLEVRLSR